MQYISESLIFGIYKSSSYNLILKHVNRRSKFRFHNNETKFVLRRYENKIDKITFERCE